MSVEATDTMLVTTRSKTPTAIIKHIIALCGFPDDSSMVEIIQQQELMDLADVITLTLDDANDIKLVNDDGSCAAKPLTHHVCKLKAFLLLYSRKCISLSSTLDEEDVLNMTKTELKDYCGSPGYHDNLSTGLSPSTKTTAIIE
jgi:hypothetical protein